MAHSSAYPLIVTVTTPIAKSCWKFQGPPSGPCVCSLLDVLCLVFVLIISSKGGRVLSFSVLCVLGLLVLQRHLEEGKVRKRLWLSRVFSSTPNCVQGHPGFIKVLNFPLKFLKSSVASGYLKSIRLMSSGLSISKDVRSWNVLNKRKPFLEIIFPYL